ncbi:MAG: ParB N-terminal domain-containing protein [Thermoprotei archaeon]
MNIEWLDPKDVSPHEDVDERLLRDRDREMHSGTVYPIVVERNRLFVIDGHHRWFVALDLGVKLPAILVNYDSVHNSSWKLKARLYGSAMGDMCSEIREIAVTFGDDYYAFYWSLHDKIVSAGHDPIAVKSKDEGCPLPPLPKREIFRAVSLGIVYPPKTTRHLFDFKVRPVNIKLS